MKAKKSLRPMRPLEDSNDLAKMKKGRAAFDDVADRKADEYLARGVGKTQNAKKPAKKK